MSNQPVEREASPHGGRRPSTGGFHGREDNLGLYAILDLPHRLGLDPLAVVDAMLGGGVGVIQLRSKHAPIERELVHALAGRCAAASVPMIINDHLELALAQIPGVTGVHLGQGDLGQLGSTRQQTRTALRERGLWLGVSTHDLTQLREAIVELEPDYVGFGPVFATGSKLKHEPVVGLDGLARACSATNVPVVAIGGIAAQHVVEIASCGAAAVAMIGGLIPEPHELDPVEIIRARCFAIARAFREAQQALRYVDNRG
jgi:thiamine-phosphate pyrophosphorylase